MKRALRLVLSVAVSLVLLWLVFHKVDFARVGALLAGVRLPEISVFIASVVFIQFARCLRWGALIRPFAKLPLAGVLRVANLGMLMVLVLPLRLGEFARPYMMKREWGTPFSATMGAVVVERAVDGLIVTLFFFLSTFANPNVPAALRGAAYVSLFVFASAMAGVLGVWLARAHVLRLVAGVLSPVSHKLATRVAGMVDAFADGLRALPDWRAMLVVIGWTVVYWLASGFGYYFAFRAFGWVVPLTAGFTLVSVLVIAIMIPAGPGFVGTFQAGVVAGLAIYGIGLDEATAYGIVIYLVCTGVTVAFGLPYVFAPGRLSAIVHAEAAGAP